jgi:hypothetical protein
MVRVEWEWVAAAGQGGRRGRGERDATPVAGHRFAAIRLRHVGLDRADVTAGGAPLRGRYDVEAAGLCVRGERRGTGGGRAGGGGARGQPCCSGKDEKGAIIEGARLG